MLRLPPPAGLLKRVLHERRGVRTSACRSTTVREQLAAAKRRAVSAACGKRWDERHQGDAAHGTLCAGPVRRAEVSGRY